MAKRKSSFGRNTSNSKRMKVNRVTESVEQRVTRLEDLRVRASTSRAAEKAEERDRRLRTERVRASTSRAAETVEQRNQRLQNDQARASTSRAAETVEQRDLRLRGQRTRTTTSRVRTDLMMEAFNYDNRRDYSIHPNVTIGQMNHVCQHCSALKFQKEAPGMCCANGKVNLPQLYEPSEPLRTYISGTNPLSIQFLNNIRKYNSCFNGGIIFLDAPGGTGKTFLLDLILAKIRMRGEIALAVASSGIAATLLEGGRTAHSAFKLPLNVNHAENPSCNLSKRSGMATVLRITKLIIWDECTMAHKRSLEALDRTLRDFKDNQQTMGGTLILLAGDFRQTLPVIPRSTPADELNACLKASPLWRNVTKITLSTNMRVHLLQDDSAQKFAKQLLNIGDGKIPADPTTNEISFPLNFCQMQSSIQDVEQKVFPNLSRNYKNRGWLCERAILAPKNIDVNHINERIQLQIPGETTKYKSIDTVVDDDQVVNYPVEFLNSLEPPGMPPHILSLKVGSPIMLL